MICKSKSWEAEQNLLKMEKDSFKTCSRKFEAGHEKSRVGFISFIIFFLKTTSKYFHQT